MTAVQLFKISPGAASAALGTLSEPEQIRAAQMQDRPRDRFVMGRALLRHMLADRLGCDPAAVDLIQEGAGRVHLSSPAGIGFSVSHTARGVDDYVAVAVGDSALGVDIEWQARMLDVGRIAARRFSDHDAALVASADLADKKQCFYRLWTLKEALVKWCDGQLLDVCAHTAFDLGSPPRFVIGTDDRFRAAHLWQQIDPVTGLVIAVAQSQDGAVTLNLGL